MKRGAVLWMILGFAGCGETLQIPQPDLQGLEAQVVEVVEAAQREVEENPGSAEAWGRLGDRYSALRWIESAECYERAEQLDPTNVRWPYLMGHSLRLDDPQAAAAAFARALALDESHASAHGFQAQMLVRLGKDEEARRHFEQATRLAPDSFHPWLGLGQLELSSGRFEEARAYLERAVELNPEYGQAHTALAQVYLALGDEAKARHHSETARGLPTPIPDPRSGYGQVEPVGSFAVARRGRELADAGKLDEAAEYLRSAIQSNPEYAVVHFNLGVVLVQKRELDEAVKHLREALRLKPVDVESHSLLGEVLFRTGKLDEAEIHLGQAVQMNPDRSLLQFLLGRVLAQQGRPGEAEVHFREALRTSPEESKTHYYLAMVLTAQENTAEAVEHFQQTLQITLQEIEQHSGQAALLERQGNNAEAARYRQEIRRLGYAVGEAHNKLGALMTKQGDVSGAVRHLSEALRLRPDHAETHLNMGRARMKQNQIDSALAEFREALRLNPGWPEAARSLAWVLATHDDPDYRDAEEAVRLAQLACEATGNGEPTALDTLAAAHAEAGRFEDAVRVARQALSVARSLEQLELAEEIRKRIRFYESSRPFRARRM